ncbi:MAG: membrane protein insertion efficiency factor YidD, partial [Gammaproteobacteria bacterium]|nr:membrane protein insertion efficiency factor YidD [Gammaproteobacteria bacterium]
MLWCLLIGGAAIAQTVDDEVDKGTGDSTVAAIRFYQSYLSSMRHGNCFFYPSCSEYAGQAIRAYGLLRGSALAVDRLMRCNKAAGRYYHRGAFGLLHDPVEGNPEARFSPRVPVWLLPQSTVAVPALNAARDAEDLLFARALSEQRDCYRAATEFLRIAHRKSLPDWHAWAHREAGYCYFECGDWLAAEQAFIKAILLDVGGGNDARSWAAASLYNAGRFGDCDRFLKGYSESSDSSTNTQN